MKKSKIIIGRRDKIDLPDLGLIGIEAKIDTGAYGSALHCHEMKIETLNGKEVLTYKVLDPSHPEYRDKKLISEHFNDKMVKSSNGMEEHRYTITTTVSIFNQTIRTEFSLTDRMEMKHPILLGRKFLSKRFVVDVNLTDLSMKNKIKQIRII
jgi:hypothetical protein